VSANTTRRLLVHVTERWAGADPGVQAVSPQVTIRHLSGGRLPLLSAMPSVTFPAVDNIIHGEA